MFPYAMQGWDYFHDKGFCERYCSQVTPDNLPRGLSCGSRLVVRSSGYAPYLGVLSPLTTKHVPFYPLFALYEFSVVVSIYKESIRVSRTVSPVAQLHDSIFSSAAWLRSVLSIVTKITQITR